MATEELLVSRPKDIVVNYRESAEIYDEIREAAWQQRMSISGFIRDAARREAVRVRRQREQAAERERERIRREILAEQGAA